MQEELFSAIPVIKKVNKEQTKPRKKNDIIFKGVFEEYFVHLLRFTYPNADQIFDFAFPFTSKYRPKPMRSFLKEFLAIGYVYAISTAPRSFPWLFLLVKRVNYNQIGINLVCWEQS
jgi:hypothetical protein